MSSTETRDRLLFRLFVVGTGKRVTSETGHTKASANPTGDQIHASFLSPQRVVDDLRDACGRAVSLPAVDAYAQSRRLQPVLRASETAAPPASGQKLRLLGLCLFSVIRHRGTEQLSRNQIISGSLNCIIVARSDLTSTVASAR